MRESLVQFTVETLSKEDDSLLQKWKSHLPGAVLKKVTAFIETNEPSGINDLESDPTIPGTPRQSVRSEEAPWMRGETSSSTCNQDRLPSIQ